MEKRVLLYDTTRGFYRFLKINISRNFQIDWVKSSEVIKNVSFSEYDYVIVVINQMDDLLELNYIKSKVDWIITCSKIELINQQLKRQKNLKVLDFSKIKIEFLNDLNNCLI